MKSLLLVLLAATALVGPCHAQSAVGDTKAPTIKVLVMNGKTGKPITDEAPNILFEGFKYPDNPQANKKGEIVLTVRSPQLMVLPNSYADCRLKGDSTAAYNVKYSVEEIIKTKKPLAALVEQLRQQQHNALMEAARRRELARLV